MELPLELLLDVIKLLSRKDKKTLRLVSKLFSAVATPLVFDSIYLSHNFEDLTKARSALDKYVSFINTIVLSPIQYLPLIKYKYKEWVKRELGLTGRSPHGWRVEEHITLGFRTLDELTSKSSFHSKGLLESLFRAKLRRSSNLKKIVITNRKRYEKFPMAKYCDLKDCGLPTEKHETFQLSPWQCSGHTPNYSLGRRDPQCLMPWIADLISGSGSMLGELIVEHERTSNSLTRINTQTFLCFTQSIIERPDLTSNLTSLRLSVDNRTFAYGSLKYERSLFRSEIDISARMMAKHLACAKNLEKLSLMIVNCPIEKQASRSPTMFHYLLHGCRFPRLRIFVLDGCSMENKEATDFLDGSPELRHLVLASCWLQGSCHWRGYNWAPFAELIKAKTHLATLSMENLVGHSTNGLDYGDRFVDPDGAVEKFLLHDGPNPFAYDSDEEYQKIWRPVDDAAVSEFKPKVDWYNETYF